MRSFGLIYCSRFPRLLLALIAVVATAYALVGCAPTPGATPIVANRGGTVILALSQEPDTLNPYIASQRAAAEVHIFMVEGLLGVDAQGEFYPVLATQVPTRENGGVSPDGLTVTYRLRQGVTWSDGKAFTCDDVLFTWQAIVAPRSGAVSTADYRDIRSVECPDPHTAVIQFKTFYAPYLIPFWTVLPRHATGDPETMGKWEYNRRPIGTGPFKMVEWVSGDHITLARNENYREKGKPYLDSVIIRFVPSRDAALLLLQSGQVTMVSDLVEANLPQLEQAKGIRIGQAPSPRSERLLLNLSDPSVDAADPKQRPHPILGDSRVRQALETAIDKKEIVDRLLGGHGDVATNEMGLGWARCEAGPAEFNPQTASQLLDQAGWPTGADGIRVARNALYAKPGTRLRLKLQGPSGDSLREQVEQLILDRWRAVGIEAFIENAPTAVLFGTWEAGAVARHGRFDVLIYTTGPYVDPQSQVEGYFGSRNIPQAGNKGAGYNYSRWIDAAADEAIQIAGSTPDLAARRAAYCQVMERVRLARPQIYLYSRAFLVAYSERLSHWAPNVWKNLGWNAAEWQLN